MIQNERQQSAVNMATRISVRFCSSGASWSVGIWLMACSSLELTKLEKNALGMSANNRQAPPMRTKAMSSEVLSERRFPAPVCWAAGCCPLAIHCLSASMASRGMVNSAMTSMDATVRNLAYMGM